MNKDSKIYVAGHNGMVGSTITRNLLNNEYENIVVRTRKQLDLFRQDDVLDFFEHEKPEYVFLAASKVGGIYANNTFRADFIYENLQIQNNVIHAAYLTGVKKLLFLGSTCIYGKECPQPIKEEYLLKYELEKTNEPYAVAKIAGIKMCESYHRQYGCDFLSVMPTNLYGFRDNYDFNNSHVFPALMRKTHLAELLKYDNLDEIKKDLKRHNDINDDVIGVLSKYGIEKNNDIVTLTLWGTGEPYREFLHVDDAADACVFIMNNISAEDLNKRGLSHINIGSGYDTTIKEIAHQIKSIIGFDGVISWDTSKPDGTFRKLTDISLISEFGWKSKISLDAGIKMTYLDYLLESLV